MVSSLVESVTVALLGLRHHFLNRLQILSTSIFTIVLHTTKVFLSDILDEKKMVLQAQFSKLS